MAFGSDVSSAAVAEQIREFDRTAWPSFALVEAGTLKGAAAAYAAPSNTIYLSKPFLEAHRTTPSTIEAVLIEEIGHAIDARLNATDAAGDEGALIASLVMGKDLSSDALRSLLAEDDHGSITVGGRALSVEFADTYGSLTLDGSLADWTSASRIDKPGARAGFRSA